MNSSATAANGPVVGDRDESAEHDVLTEEAAGTAAGDKPSADVLTPADLEHRPTPAWKRVFDFFGALVLLVVLSPVLFAVALYIRCVSRGRVLFTQSRLGEMGEYFKIYKFRTLHPKDPEQATAEHREYMSGLAGSNQAIEKPDLADRFIRGGEFLRASSLDELPQLINVLIGNMSLVGPRPDVLHWQDYPAWQLRRFEAKPGMTGLWQVSGKNRLTYDEMVELDLTYIEKRSLRLDLEILFRTVAVVLSKDND